jgi:hypothetical protein
MSWWLRQLHFVLVLKRFCPDELCFVAEPFVFL